RARALSFPVYFIRLSEKAEIEGDFQGAAGAAQEAIRTAPGFAGSHERLALVRMRTGGVTRGLAGFRTTAALDGGDPAIPAYLAAALLEAGLAAEALPVFDRAIQLDPDLLRTYANRARCLDALGRNAEAEAAWRDYLSRADSRPEEAESIEAARRRLALG